MTTIAWDGTTLAADRLASGGGPKSCRVLKLRRAVDGRLLAATGWCDTSVLFLDWLEAKDGERPKWQQEDDPSVGALEVMPDGRVFRHGRYGAFQLLEPRLAMGSGEQYAMGAMLAGANAVRAVEIACELDTWSGGGVDTLTLHPAPAGEDRSEDAMRGRCAGATIGASHDPPRLRPGRVRAVWGGGGEDR